MLGWGDQSAARSALQHGDHAAYHSVGIAQSTTARVPRRAQHHSTGVTQSTTVQVSRRASQHRCHAEAPQHSCHAGVDVSGLCPGCSTLEMGGRGRSIAVAVSRTPCQGCCAVAFVSWRSIAVTVRLPLYPDVSWPLCRGAGTVGIDSRWLFGCRCIKVALQWPPCCSVYSAVPAPRPL